MNFKTFNPATGEELSSYSYLSFAEVCKIIKQSQDSYLTWRNSSILDKQELFMELAFVLKKNLKHYSETITKEMGKPIAEAQAEIEKCAKTSEFYAKNSATWMQPESVIADGVLNEVEFRPLGVILSIMPWNFPFWQALRFAIPTLMSGNVSVLKHSDVTSECALEIEKAFLEAGFPKNVFQSVFVDHQTVAKIIELDSVRGITLTGSCRAGSQVGALAGKYLKKVVLELGGSDPFIVLEDADLELATQNAVLGRFMNSGQSCIAAKRIIVQENVAPEFIEKFVKLVKKVEVGPLVTQKALDELDSQVLDAVHGGAKVLCGGKKKEGKGFFYLPTVLVNTESSMRVVTEEVFGPVAPVIVVSSESEAVNIANDVEFGLGASVWTRDLKRGRRVVDQLECGVGFVNSIVKSDPRMPFGGIKNSGFGRELSRYGLLEFVNVKGVNVYR